MGKDIVLKDFPLALAEPVDKAIHKVDADGEVCYPAIFLDSGGEHGRRGYVPYDVWEKKGILVF